MNLFVYYLYFVISVSCLFLVFFKSNTIEIHWTESIALTVATINISHSVIQFVFICWFSAAIRASNQFFPIRPQDSDKPEDKGFTTCDQAKEKLYLFMVIVIYASDPTAKNQSF